MSQLPSLFTPGMRTPDDWHARRRELIELSQAKNTWFFKDPLNCIVKITNTGKSILISVDGAETEYLYGVLPPVDKPPRISSRSYMISR